MRWWMIRLIWFRELRDQLRDRRTVFMIAVLPVLLYPLAGLGMAQLAGGVFGQRNLVGVVGLDNLHPWPDAPTRADARRVASLLATTPPPPGCPGGFISRAVGATSLALATPTPHDAAEAVALFAMSPGSASPADALAPAISLHLAASLRDYPPLVEEADGKLAFRGRYVDGSPATIGLRRVASIPDIPFASQALYDAYRPVLDARTVDVLLVVPDGFQSALAAGGRPEIFLFSRERDDNARLTSYRVTAILSRWRRDLREARFVRAGLPADFDQPVLVTDAEAAKPQTRVEEESLLNVVVKVFPFVLVMWSLAGALYPAVDVCAGEKERGTMETLLISPAGRDEIVWGKFLTIWVFSASTALLNLLSMAATAWQLTLARPGGGGFSPMPIVWGVVLLMPLSAFFSAVGLAVGAYARSSKEGQYYLMPLFLLTMPLIFLTLSPDVKLNAFYSMVPVTGVALLLQKLILAETGDRVLWLFFVPVMGSMMIYSWLALRWAVGQFQREEVLFREAERLDIGLWLRRLLREKEPMPSPGQAFFCFALIVALRLLSFGVGSGVSLPVRTAVGLTAFVLVPPLFMAILLTTRPLRGLGVRPPPWWGWVVAPVLAVLVLPPLAELTLVILEQFPALKVLLELDHPLTRELKALSSGASTASGLVYFLALAVAPAVCEELAFRGLILHGLLRGFKPATAVVLSAVLFAVYQMNVFQFMPHFVFGVILGVVVVRTGSVLPAVLFHLVYNSLLIAPVLVPEWFAFAATVATPAGTAALPERTALRYAVSGACAAAAAVTLAGVWWLAPAPRDAE